MNSRSSRPKAAQASKKSSKPQPGRSQRTATLARAPVAQSLTVRTAGPTFSEMRQNSIRVRHREFLWDIAGSVEFAWDQFPINPGLAETFPWLSAIANRFESYKFHALRFVVEPTAPTTASGSVILAVDYDAQDPGPDTKTVALAYKNAVRAAPWAACAHVSDPADLHKLNSHFVRSGVVSASDIKTYDVGNLFVATAGQAGTTDISELYVEYDVELFTPQLNNSPPSADYKNSTGGGMSTNNFFGTPALQVAQSTGGLANNIDLTFVDTATARINQAGVYLLELIAGAATSVSFGDLTSGAGFVQQIGTKVLSSIATTQSASYVFKANRGDLIRPLLTITGAASDARMRLTQAAAAA